MIDEQGKHNFLTEIRKFYMKHTEKFFITLQTRL